MTLFVSDVSPTVDQKADINFFLFRSRYTAFPRSITGQPRVKSGLIILLKLLLDSGETSLSRLREVLSGGLCAAAAAAAARTMYVTQFSFVHFCVTG